MLTEHPKADVPPRQLSIYASPSGYASHDSFATSQTGNTVLASCGKDAKKFSQLQGGK